jgi:hypothetical protein
MYYISKSCDRLNILTGGLSGRIKLYKYISKEDFVQSNGLVDFDIYEIDIIGLSLYGIRVKYSSYLNEHFIVGDIGIRHIRLIDGVNFSDRKFYTIRNPLERGKILTEGLFPVVDDRLFHISGLSGVIYATALNFDNSVYDMLHIDNYDIWEISLKGSDVRYFESPFRPYHIIVYDMVEASRLRLVDSVFEQYNKEFIKL